MAETSDTSMPSFDDLSLPSFNVPSAPVEDSIADSLPVNATSHEPPELEYHLIPGASKFGKDILTDSRGFSYTMKWMKGTGLQSAYTSDNATHKYIKKLMSLPYLPGAHIQPILPECQCNRMVCSDTLIRLETGSSCT